MENAYGYLCGLLSYGNIQEYQRIISLALNTPTLTSDDEFWKDRIQEIKDR